MELIPVKSSEIDPCRWHTNWSQEMERGRIYVCEVKSNKFFLQEKMNEDLLYTWQAILVCNKDRKFDWQDILQWEENVQSFLFRGSSYRIQMIAACLDSSAVQHILGLRFNTKQFSPENTWTYSDRNVAMAVIDRTSCESSESCHCTMNDTMRQ